MVSASTSSSVGFASTTAACCWHETWQRPGDRHKTSPRKRAGSLYTRRPGEGTAMQSRDLPTRGARREEGEGVSRLPWLQPRFLAGEHKRRPEGMTQLLLHVAARPRVRKQVALGERIRRVDEHLRHACDPRTASDRRDDRGAAADGGLGDD